jgi:hypothetical protein
MEEEGLALGQYPSTPGQLQCYVRQVVVCMTRASKIDELALLSRKAQARQFSLHWKHEASFGINR